MWYQELNTAQMYARQANDCNIFQTHLIFFNMLYMRERDEGESKRKKIEGEEEREREKRRREEERGERRR